VLAGAAMQLNVRRGSKPSMARAEKVTAPLVGAAPALQQAERPGALADARPPRRRRKPRRQRATAGDARALRSLQAHAATRDAPSCGALVKEQVGLIGSPVIDATIDYFTTDATGARGSIPSWRWCSGTFYSRAKSLPTRCGSKGARADMPPILMTCAWMPEPMLVRAMILRCQRRKPRLQGRRRRRFRRSPVNRLKARLMPRSTRTLRNLATIIQTKTHMPLTFG